MAGRNSEATNNALRRHVVDGVPIGRAAAEAGISRSTLHRAIGRRLEADGTEQPRVVIAGAGGLGREVASWITAERPDARIVYLSDAPAPGLVVIGGFASYAAEAGDELIVALGDPDLRAGAVARIGAPVAGWRSASALIGIGAQIGAGCLLLPRTVVSAAVVLGEGVVVNLHSTIGHDAVLGDWTTLSSGVDITGRVRIGARVFIGSGARVIPGIEVGDGATIGAGAVVMNDVPAGAHVAGNPARRIS